MADNTLTEVPAADTAEEAEAAGSRKKLMIVGGMLLMAAAAAAYLLFAGGGDADADAEAAAAAADLAELQDALDSGVAIDPATLSPEQLAALVPPTGEVLDIGAMTVNLQGAEASYGRVGFAVVLAPGTDAATVETKAAVLRDQALSEIMSYTAEALRTPEGVQALRDGLTNRFKELFPLGEVEDVVLTELLVQ